jgi:hypothetical protein
VAQHWHTLQTKELLDLRLCDLGVRVEDSWLVPLIDRVLSELEARELAVRPHFWFADEWFSPDGVPGIAIPFYLAHKRLMRLERAQMFDVEGGTRAECMMLLRHELGHVIDTAFGLNRRRRWRELFGRNADAYPEYYRPNPASKKYVVHLDGWYAQAHPAEDFAETFAVWLRPGQTWRERYLGWPALRKLEYVDELMHELRGCKPKRRSRAKPYSLSRLRHTLRTHYQRKRDHYEPGFSNVHDRNLFRLFSADPKYSRRPTAAAFLRKHRSEIRRLVARWTGEYEFVLDQVLKMMIGRCRELQLRMTSSEREAKSNFTVMLAVSTMQYLHRGHEWHPM